MLEKALAGFEKSRAHLYPPSVSFTDFFECSNFLSLILRDSGRFLCFSQKFCAGNSVWPVGIDPLAHA